MTTRPRIIATILLAGLLAGGGRADDAAAPGAASAPLAPTLDDAWDAVAPDLPDREDLPVERARDNRALRAAAASDSEGRPSWLRSFVSLAGVVALILLLAWGYRAMAGGGGFALAGRLRRPGLIEVLSRTALSPRQSLCLVRVGPRLVLVGVTSDRLSALDVIADPELTARRRKLDGSSQQFERLLTQEAKQYSRFDRKLDEDEAPDEQRLVGVKRALAGTLQRICRGAAGA